MNKIKISSPSGAHTSPYWLKGSALVKQVKERHIYRLRQAVGIDEQVWQDQRSHVSIVRFVFPDGSVREIGVNEFQGKSFLHGDGARFAVTRFVALADLVLVKDGMRSLFN